MAEKKKSAPPNQPYGAYHFKLVFDGEDGEIPVFEVSGLKTAARVEEIAEGGLNTHVHKRPDRSRWDNLVVRYGTQAKGPLQAWRDAFLRDPFDADLRRTGAVVLLDDEGHEVRSYQFVEAWPVSWEGPTLDADSSSLATETLEIAHEGLTITIPDGGSS